MNKINSLIEAGEKATAGPWKHDARGCVETSDGLQLTRCTIQPSHWGDDVRDANAEFIAAIRNALPEIVELVEFARDYRFHRHLKGCPMAVCQDECIDDHIDPTHPFTGNGHECTTCQGVPEDHVCTCGLDRIREICDE